MRDILQSILAIILFGGLAWGLYELIALLLEYISTLNNEVATAIIAGSTTLIISVISVVLGKYYERKLTIEKSLREKKIPAYQNLVKFFFELLYEQGKKGNKFSDEELMDNFSEITQDLMIWGSDEVIKKWSEFRQQAANSNQVKASYQTIILLEDLLKEIRKDIGYNGWKLNEGELLGLFINNIKNELQQAKQK